MRPFVSPLVVDPNQHRPVIGDCDSAVFVAIRSLKLNRCRDRSNSISYLAIYQWCGYDNPLAALLVDNTQFPYLEFLTWLRLR